MSRLGEMSGKVGDVTPWGVAQTAEKLCDGVILYGTGSHGGYWVSNERMEQMPELLRGCSTFAGRGWYEEDVDAMLVILAFPRYFEDKTLWQVLGAARRCWDHPGAREFVDSAAGAVVRAAAARFERANGHLWLGGSMMSDGDGWKVWFRRIADGKSAFVVKMTDDEAFNRSPVDVSVYGARVTYEA